MFTFLLNVIQDLSWPFKKKMFLFCYFFSLNCTFQVQGLEVNAIYAINLTSIENLIEVIMISLVSC